ncbi:MAG: hypothetical protein N3H30_00970 [Candidatus Micrarchaeota archaeon]|nr:hypothetical protein [Candidatus Micrarchaeota archaeon]
MMAQRIQLIAVALLLSLPLVSAGIGTDVKVIESIISQSGGAYVAVGLSLLIAALLYMGSSLFQDPKMSAQAKDTFYTSIGSLILIASLPAIYFFTSTIVTQILLGEFNLPSNADMYDVSAMFLAWNQVFLTINLLVVTAVNFYIVQFLSGSYSVPAGSGKLVPISFGTFARPLMFVLGIITNMLSVGIMLNAFQIMFLNFIHQSILPVFLPLGVILRAFTPTMHAGNVLIGIAIGAYIITPAVFALDLWILSGIVEDRSESGAWGIGALGLFYNKDILATVVSSRDCPGINYIVDKFIQRDYSIVDVATIEEKTKEGTCGAGIGPLAVLNSTLKSIPPWGKVALGSAGLAAGTTLAAKVLEKLGASPGGISKLSKFAGVMRKVSVVSIAVAALTLSFLAYDIMDAVGTSLVILIGILPFINLTIIVLFMREFSQVVLGTPLNLSHLVRLI